MKLDLTPQNVTHATLAVVGSLYVLAFLLGAFISPPSTVSDTEVAKLQAKVAG